MNSNKETKRKLIAAHFCLALSLLFVWCLTFLPTANALAVVVAAGDDVPAWARQIANSSAPPYDKDVPAVVLLQEERKTVDAEGRTLTVTLYAMRVLNRNGRLFARADETYIPGSSKVREMRGWLIKPSGVVKTYGKSETADVAAIGGSEMYSEARARIIDATDDAETGSVFAYESTVEDKSIFTQFEYSFQNRLPVMQARFALTLPTGWRAESVTFNRDAVKPQINNSVYTWELLNLAPIEPEPASPKVAALAPRIGVSYFPAADGKQMAGGAFTNWQDASRWLSQLTDSQSAPDEAIAAKAKALTANAKTEFERINAIASFVQNIQYVSISLNLARGGGYKPRLASEVLAKAWGDCKDKANLMKAMLKVVGIESYLMPIYAGDKTYVREVYPSPSQFNHCIIAVKVSDATQSPTIIAHPQLGRLLIFDPTDETTQLGDLPDHEQASFALIVAGERGSLVRVPATEPEVNSTQRIVTAQLAADGSLKANVRESFSGQAAASSRREVRDRAKGDYAKMLEQWIAATGNNATLTNFNHDDNRTAHRFDLTLDFDAPAYAQTMQGRLMVFRPAILAQRSYIALSAATRKHPLVLDAEAFSETTNIKLPEGFTVDELPDATKLETTFGSYQMSYQIKEGQLICERKMMVRASTLPATDYDAVRKFYGRILSAEQAPAVLVKN